LSGLENSSEFDVDNDFLFNLDKERVHVIEEIEQLGERVRVLKEELESLWATSKAV